RNTRVIDIVHELNEYGIDPLIIDPVADTKETEQEYGLHLNNIEEAKNLDAIILAVSHDEFKSFSMEKWSQFFANKKKKVMIDIKGLINKDELNSEEFIYWGL